jgi:acetyl-CoA carboxylase biotin carboxyl carrier protein
MDLNYVKKLVKLLSESTLDELEIEEEGKKIRLSKHAPTISAAPQVQYIPAPVGAAATVAPVATQAAPQAATQSAAAATTAPPPADDKKYHAIKSPIVGTFYKSPAPDAAAFVQVGSPISPGTVLCIVEAMKLMNEIESDVSGKIVKILVENGQPVEYDQTLFLVETA